jgi:beta-galactosidase
LRKRLDWVEYKEYQVQWALGRLSELYRSRGLGAVPLFHNFYGPWTTPFNVADVEADAGIDFCGLDAYPHAETALDVVDQARFLGATSRLAYFPEYGAGSWPFGIRARDLHDQECTMLAPLMGGARGVNFYMLVERDRWLGSPLDNLGRRREENARLFDRFNAFLRETEWAKATPLNQGLVLFSREAQQWESVYGAPSTYAELRALPEALLHSPGDASAFGEGIPGPAQARAFFKAARAFCAGKHFSFSLADSAVSTDRLKRHAFVFAALPEFVDEGLAKRLRGFVEEGGLLVLGPSLPSLSSRFEPLKAFEDLALTPGKATACGDGRILWLKSFDEAAVAALLRKSKVFAETELSDPSLELAAHKSGGRMLLFVRNPHAEERPAKVLREGKFVLKPLWASGKFLGAVEERDVVLAPHEIKVWEVIPVA